MNEIFKNWLITRKIRFSYDDDSLHTSVDYFGKVFFAEGIDGKILDDEAFNLCLTEDDENYILEEGIDYIAFEFGNIIYYCSVEEYQDGAVRLRPFEYVGVCSDLTSSKRSMLGVHGHNEILSGTRDYSDWCKKANFLGVSSLGICEKNTLAGILDFQKKCQKNNINPVIGESIMISTDGSDVFIKLYVVNSIGYQNILKIDQAINCENIERSVHPSFLRDHSEGLICVIDPFIIPYLPKIKHNLDFFDKVYFNIDFRPFDSSRIDQDFLEWSNIYLINYLEEYEPVFISDAYYLEESHFHISDTISKINSPFPVKNYMSKKRYFNTVGDSIPGFTSLFTNKEKSKKLFLKALHNTEKITKTASFKIDSSEIYMPRYKMSKDESEMHESNNDFFMHLCATGLKKKIDTSDDKEKDKYVSRLKSEIKVIKDAEFIDYFLILYKLIEFCDKNNIQYALGRGSAAGSLVSYCLGIVGIDPIKWGLMFSRFLNSGRIPKYHMVDVFVVEKKNWRHKFFSGQNIKIGDSFMTIDEAFDINYDLGFKITKEKIRFYTRKSLPDIDTDFDANKRHLVVDFLRDIIGKDRVCSIGTIQEIGLKSGVKELGKINGADFAKINNINKKFDYETDTMNSISDSISDKLSDLEKILWVAHDSKDVKRFMDEFPRACQDLGLISGSPKSVGIHACGYLTVPSHDQLGNKLSIFDLLPVRKDGDNYVSYWNGGEVEDVGMVKLDLLATKQLTKFAEIFESIERDTGKKISISDIPLDDENVYEYFKNGWNSDVFQFSSEGMSGFSRKLKPDTIHDLIAMNALFRPATLRMNMHEVYMSRKNGEEDWDYMWGCEDALKNTYGVVCYQESSMQIVKDVAGFTEVEADDFRKVTAKKQLDKIDDFAEKFIEGAVNNGCPPDQAQEIWEVLIKFAEYSFNLSHAACYAIIGYASQWLKVNYPINFWKTALGMVDSKKLNSILEEMENIGGVVVSPVDINISSDKFKTKGDEIFWSLNRVKFVGDIAVNEIISNREQEGDFYSIGEFISRVDPSKVNTRIVRNLIISGAFDKIYSIKNTKERFNILEEYMNESGKKWKDIENYRGKNNSFWSIQGKDLSGIGVIDYKQEILSNDETKGLYTNYLGFHEISMIENEGKYCNFAGRIESIVEKNSKGGKWALLVIRNNSSSLQLNFWNDVWSTDAAKIKSAGVGSMVIVESGKIKYDSYRKKNIIYSNTKTKTHIIK
jgi:DNA polymerase-3 subunit alpha